MINRLSTRIVTFLISKNKITEEKQELYIYGLFLFISMAMFFALALILGAILGVFVESVLFLILFSTLRMFSGGYHTKQEWTCEVSSAIAIILVVLAMWFLKSHPINQTVSLLISILLTFIITVLSPVESESKRLSERENRLFKNITVMLTIVLFAAFMVSQLAGHAFLEIPIFVTFIYQSILLIAATVQYRRNNKKRQSDNK